MITSGIGQPGSELGIFAIGLNAKDLTAHQQGKILFSDDITASMTILRTRPKNILVILPAETQEDLIEAIGHILKDAGLAEPKFNVLQADDIQARPMEGEE